MNEEKTSETKNEEEKVFGGLEVGRVISNNVLLGKLNVFDRESSAFRKLGPYDSMRTSFDASSFHMLDPELKSQNPLFIIYREAFEGRRKGLSRLIMNFPLEGQMSPKHAVTLDDQSKKNANIPPRAKYYAWSYPFDIEWRYWEYRLMDELEKCNCWGCPELMFLIMGGFVYFDENNEVLSANGLICVNDPQVERDLLKTGRGLKFGKSIPFPAKYTNQLTRFDRFKTFSWPGLSNLDFPPSWFAWLRPNEELVAPDRERMTFGTHGGFIFLFHLDLNERDERKTNRNCYFPVICSNSMCCSEASHYMRYSKNPLLSGRIFMENMAEETDEHEIVEDVKKEEEDDLMLPNMGALNDDTEESSESDFDYGAQAAPNQYSQRMGINILRNESNEPTKISAWDIWNHTITLIRHKSAETSKTSLQEIKEDDIHDFADHQINIPSMVHEVTSIITSQTLRFAESANKVDDKIFVCFLASLPDYVLEKINLDSLFLTDTNTTSVIHVKVREVILRYKDHEKRVQKIRELVKNDKDLNLKLDNFTSELLEEAFDSHLKADDEDASIEQRLLFKELIRRFYYYVKPDAQVKAEIEASIKENNWLKRNNRGIYRLIRSTFKLISGEDAYSDCSYLAKLVMGFVQPPQKIPYSEHGGNAIFQIDEHVLIKPQNSGEKPRLAVIQSIEDDFFVVKEKGEEKEEWVEMTQVQRPFKWKCVRCGNDDNEMWRDIYPLKNWVCCLTCGLVTERTLSEIRYNLRNLVKQSVYGGIYYSYDAYKNRDCAIKRSEKRCMRAKTRRDDDKRVAEDIDNEYKYHWLVCNENLEEIPYGILQIYDHYEDDDYYFMVLEWANAGELFEYVLQNFTSNEGKFLHDKVAQVEWQPRMQQMFYEICMGVKKLHDSEIVHRDLSLENVLIIKNEPYVKELMPKLRPCICDFGLAVDNDDCYFKNQQFAVGKATYMSKELCTGNYDGKAADIWALGVMLTMMLIGAPPYAEMGGKAFRLYCRGKKGIKHVFKSYRRNHLVSEEAYEVLAGVSAVEGKRMTIDEVLATKYCQTAPFRNYRD